MSQNVTIAGASYPDVPAIDIAKTGGGTARFVDTSDANATAGDIASGKSAYVGGVKLTGTNSGGGGGGVSSWNDLTDRPFYETVTAPGYNYVMDLAGSYVSGTFDIGAEVPCKFYRVGDPLTAAQLEGAMGSVYNSGETNSHVIESNYIEAITDNGNTIGYFVAGDAPYALVINNANTTIDYSGANFGCAGTFASAGTYLLWLDLSIMEEGASAYNVSLVKDDVVTVTPLPEKYYKAPFNITADFDIDNYSSGHAVSNVSKTFAEIFAAIQSGRTTTLWLSFTNQDIDFSLPLYPTLVSELQIHFCTTAPATLGGNTNPYLFDVYINTNDSVYSALYLLSASM